MGVIMGSVTDIVNMISLVLIAFVSISLVVSSIMIGIITYISVLERKKEIGILRAIGASKGNVANVFNAETFIEGLISGAFAIAVVVAVSVPVNAWVLADFKVENIMSLPWTSAAVLICISVVLTLWRASSRAPPPADATRSRPCAASSAEASHERLRHRNREKRPIVARALSCHHGDRGAGMRLLRGPAHERPDMRAAADAYYDDTGLWDLRVISTLALARRTWSLAELEGVDAAAGITSVDAMVRLGTGTGCRARGIVSR